MPDLSKIKGLAKGEIQPADLARRNSGTNNEYAKKVLYYFAFDMSSRQRAGDKCSSAKVDQTSGPIGRSFHAHYRCIRTRLAVIIWKWGEEAKHRSRCCSVCHVRHLSILASL